jgi:hypothetical protein
VCGLGALAARSSQSIICCVGPNKNLVSVMLVVVSILKSCGSGFTYMMRQEVLLALSNCRVCMTDVHTG